MGESLRQAELVAEPMPAPSPCRRCGLDEVGRGALAGPLVAAAVILPDDIVTRLGPLARFLRDSKTVPPARRRDLATAIRVHALAVELIEIDVETINAHGIGWANREAFRRLIATVVADEYIVDGKVRPPVPPETMAQVRCFARADAQVPAVAAASLVAKVHRDDLMARLHASYPHFGWDANAGYAAPAHLAALRAQGPCPQHRTMFVATVFAGGQKAKRGRGDVVGARTLLETPAEAEDRDESIMVKQSAGSGSGECPPASGPAPTRRIASGSETPSRPRRSRPRRSR